MNYAVGAAAMVSAVVGGCVLVGALYAFVALGWLTAASITLLAWPFVIGVLAHVRVRRLGETSLGSSVRSAALAALLAFALVLAAPIEELAVARAAGEVWVIAAIMIVFTAIPEGCSFFALPFLVHVASAVAAASLAWYVERRVGERLGRHRRQ
jgi:hypothetical protein